MLASPRITQEGYVARIRNQLTYGGAVLERLQASPHAGALKKSARDFGAVHDRYGKACARVDAALEKRDDALDDVGGSDGKLDPLLLALANGMVGAGLGQRQNPFKGFSPHAPQALADLAYATEVAAVRDLIKNVRKAKPPAVVLTALGAAGKAADAVEAALQALSAPQAAYEAAMRERDALLLGWNKALGRLKRVAAVVYDEDKAGCRALFAPAQRVQAPQKKRKAKAPKEPPKDK